MTNESQLSPEVPSVAPRKNRRGMALVTVILAIVVLSAIVTGTFFSSTQEFRGGRNALVEQRAFATAEFGLNSAISNWDRSRNLPPPLGRALGNVDSSLIFVDQSDTARVRITRLTINTFQVVSEGRANIGNRSLESKRSTNAMVRIAYPTIKPKGAITAAGNVSVQGSATVNGANTNPTGWTACSAVPTDTVPAITAGPSATVTYNASNILSSPAVLRDSAAADSNTYIRYGSESWNSLTANADVKLAGGLYGSNIGPVGTATTCDYSQQLNWGEPKRPGAVVGCYMYYPIIYSASSLKINGNGYGQGILLVNGDLEINGTFEFYGLVIVRDDLNRSNGTALIHGAVYAANMSLQDPSSSITGNQTIQYSKCAVETALRASAILTRAKERGWGQIF